ncbi:MAG TPA: hypothetical protein VKV26_14455 [Dehalococcoidia bacterium]|nr:hypothetical protein [Dehalococcoidia bacterium]
MIEDLYFQARLRDLSRDVARIAGERRALAALKANAAGQRMSRGAAAPAGPDAVESLAA